MHHFERGIFKKIKNAIETYDVNHIIFTLSTNLCLPDGFSKKHSAP